MTTTVTGKGPIRALPPLEAPDVVRAEARANCAARCRARGEHLLAISYEDGGQDEGWAMRHEVARLGTEAARS